MAWKTVVENKEQYPQKGEKGFKQKPLSERVSKVMTVRLTQEQVNVMKKSLEHLPFTSLSDLTRTALLEYLVNHQIDITDQYELSPNQLNIFDAFDVDSGKSKDKD
jgi:Arc/MetJ-type ribon-helix-helix transcriptional regulator